VGIHICIVYRGVPKQGAVEFGLAFQSPFCGVLLHFCIRILTKQNTRTHAGEKRAKHVLPLGIFQCARQDAKVADADGCSWPVYMPGLFPASTTTRIFTTFYRSNGSLFAAVHPSLGVYSASCCCTPSQKKSRTKEPKLSRRFWFRDDMGLGIGIGFVFIRMSGELGEATSKEHQRKEGNSRPRLSFHFPLDSLRLTDPPTQPGCKDAALSPTLSLSLSVSRPLTSDVKQNRRALII